MSANNMNPVCEIVEYASRRFNRFWNNAEIEPTTTDETPEKRKRGDQKVWNSRFTIRNILISKPKTIIFGTAENNNVTDNKEPS